MNTEKRNYFSESSLSTKPSKKIGLVIADSAVTTSKLATNAVATEKIQSEAITPSKLSPLVRSEVVVPTIRCFTDPLHEEMERLKQLVRSYNQHGFAVSNEFGDDTAIGISQKTLTDALNKIWQKFEDITGEILQGINMVVTPNYFISKDGCDIHIAANTVETNGIFERIQFFVDGEKIYEDVNTEYVEPFVYHIDSKPTYGYVVMCKAKIMGVWYTRQKVITRYNEFYIGAGSDYTDVMNAAHAKQLEGRMRHDYDVTFTDGQKLIIVIGSSLRSGFIRADLNGAEIEMTEVRLDAEGHVIPDEDTTTEVKYIGFMSDSWSEGNYNIDING